MLLYSDYEISKDGKSLDECCYFKKIAKISTQRNQENEFL